MQAGHIPNPQTWPMTCTSKGLDTLIREQLYGKAGSWQYDSQFTTFRLEGQGYAPVSSPLYL